MCRPSNANAATCRKILVASGPRGHFRALCIVEAKRAEGDITIATVSKLYIDSVLDPDRVAQAMLCALAAYCRDHGFSKLQIAMRGSDETSIVKMAAANTGAQPAWLQLEMI
jgi:hypothetical protein